MVLKERRFRTFLVDEEAKNERKPKRRFLREMLRREDEVDDEDEVLESARERIEEREAWECIGGCWGWGCWYWWW